MPTAVNGTWVGVIAGLIGLVAALLARRWARTDEETAAERLRNEALKKAARDYRLARARRDEEGAVRAMQRYNYIKAGGKFLMLLATAFCMAACRTATPPKPLLVPVGKYVLYPAPGTVVPELPAGQTHWLLLSEPQGVELMLPMDFPLEETKP